MPYFFYKDIQLVESLEVNVAPKDMPPSCLYCGNGLWGSNDHFTAYGHDIWYELRFCGRCGWWDLVYRNDMESGPHDEEVYYQSRLRVLDSDSQIDFASMQLISELQQGKESLYDVAPRKFEGLVKSLLSDHLDCKIEMTKSTRDGGKDLIGFDSDNGAFFVEVKRYKPEHKIGVGVVRNFVGAMFLEGVQDGFLVSSSSFTKDAKDVANALHLKSNWNLHLRDSRDIASWLKFSFDRYFDTKELNNIIGGVVSPGPGAWPVVPDHWFSDENG